MSRITKISLGLTIVNVVASALFLPGIIDVSNTPGLYVVFPLAAIFGGAAMLSHTMEREVAAFDTEHHTPGKTDPPAGG